MSAPTIRISEASHQILKELADQTGQTGQDVLDKALDAYRRKLFFEQLNVGYAELRTDPEAWAEHLSTWEDEAANVINGIVRNGRMFLTVRRTFQSDVASFLSETMVLPEDWQGSPEALAET